MLNKYISEKPKGRANKSKERAKRRVGRARSKKEGKVQKGGQTGMNYILIRKETCLCINLEKMSGFIKYSTTLLPVTSQKVG